MSELTREDVLAIRQRLVRQLDDSELKGILNDLAINDASLRARLEEQVKRAEQAERICSNAVWQISYMVEEINKALGLSIKSTPADTVTSVRDAASMLQERDDLRQHVADLTAKLGASITKVEHNKIVENVIMSLDAERTSFEQELAATQETIAKLEEEIEVGLQVSGSFFYALKPLGLSSLNVLNPGAHVTELITERDQLQATLTAQREEIGKHQRISELLHLIVEHDDGDFDSPEIIEAECRQYGIENLLVLKRLAMKHREEIGRLRAVIEKAASAAGSNWLAQQLELCRALDEGKKEAS